MLKELPKTGPEVDDPKGILSFVAGARIGNELLVVAPNVVAVVEL